MILTLREQKILETVFDSDLLSGQHTARKISKHCKIDYGNTLKILHKLASQNLVIMKKMEYPSYIILWSKGVKNDEKNRAYQSTE